MLPLLLRRLDEDDDELLDDDDDLSFSPLELLFLWVSSEKVRDELLVSPTSHLLALCFLLLPSLCELAVALLVSSNARVMACLRTLDGLERSFAPLVTLPLSASSSESLEDSYMLKLAAGTTFNIS